MKRTGWRLEEKQVKVSGEPGYLWTAVDRDGEVLDFYITAARDKDAALAFLRRALERRKISEIVATGNHPETR